MNDPSIEVIGEYEKRPDDRAKLLSGNRKCRKSNEKCVSSFEKKRI